MSWIVGCIAWAVWLDWYTSGVAKEAADKAVAAAQQAEDLPVPVLHYPPIRSQAFYEETSIIKRR